MKKRFLILLSFWIELMIFAFVQNHFVFAEEFIMKTDSYNFETGWQQTLEKNLFLAAEKFEIDVSISQIRQAKLFPNPELSISNEKTDYTYSGYEVSENTYGITQTFETGGKRKHRISIAETEKVLSQYNFDIRLLDLRVQYTTAFVKALSAQEKNKLAEENLKVIDGIHRTIIELTRAGKVPPLEEKRSTVELNLAAIESNKAKSNFLIAARELSSLWGDSDPEFKNLSGNLEAINKIPQLPALSSALQNNPDIVRFEKLLELKQNTLKFEKSMRIPDVTIGGGVKTDNNTDDKTYIIEMSLPIPIFNRNQGNIIRAEKELEKIKHEKLALELQIKTSFKNYITELENIKFEISIFKDQVIPGASQAIEAAKEGYKLGKYAYLDLLEAQRVYIKSRTEYINILEMYWELISKIERITGNVSLLSF